MGAAKSDGFTLEFQKQSYLNFNKQVENLKKLAPAAAKKGMFKILFDIKALAQNKLKSDEHIDTSRLRNSLYVKGTSANSKLTQRPNNGETYSDGDGKTYSSELEVSLTDNDGAVGTNVEYAAAIEFGYPPMTITAKGKTLAYKLRPGKEFTKGLFASINWNSSLATKEVSKPRSSDTWVILGKSVKHPGFKGDSFLYWALKNVDLNRRWREVSAELLGDLSKKGRQAK